MTYTSRITARDVLEARNRISSIIRRTPLVSSPGLERRFDIPVYLKLEHHQVTGSFKLRGAANAVRCLDPLERKRGVVGVSTGNYGKALSHAASRLNIRCVICMSSLVPENKVQGVKDAGGEVRIIGQSQDEAQQEVNRLIDEEQMIMLPPFDHPDVISGQGTLGLEIIEERPEIDTFLVPVSGGGLAAGVALAVKTLAPKSKIIGLTMDRGASMYESIKAGKPVEVQEYASLADSLGGGIGLDNKYTFPMVRDLVDEIILLSEEEIAAGISHAYWQEGEIVEGAGAVGIAALLAGKFQPTGPTAILLTGGNIDRALHHRITGEQATRKI